MDTLDVTCSFLYHKLNLGLYFFTQKILQQTLIRAKDFLNRALYKQVGLLHRVVVNLQDTNTKEIVFIHAAWIRFLTTFLAVSLFTENPPNKHTQPTLHIKGLYLLHTKSKMLEHQCCWWCAFLKEIDCNSVFLGFTRKITQIFHTFTLFFNIFHQFLIHYSIILHMELNCSPVDVLHKFLSPLNSCCDYEFLVKVKMRTKNPPLIFEDNNITIYSYFYFQSVRE